MAGPRVKFSVVHGTLVARLGLAFRVTETHEGHLPQCPNAVEGDPANCREFYPMGVESCARMGDDAVVVGEQLSFSIANSRS